VHPTSAYDEHLALGHPIPVHRAAHIRRGRLGVRFGTVTWLARHGMSQPEIGIARVAM
jgi:hypothetical protein